MTFYFNNYYQRILIYRNLKIGKLTILKNTYIDEKILLKI